MNDPLAEIAALLSEVPEVNDYPWMRRANCRGVASALFYPTRGQSEEAKQAKAVCAGCTVQPECLEYALSRRIQFGIWGGLTDHERRRLLRERATG